MTDMKRLRVLLSVAALMAAAVWVIPAQDAGPGAIKMTAKKYAFEPNEIKVKKGDHVRLVITSLDHDHGIKLQAFHIDRKLPKGQPVTIEFDADQAGTFPFECSVFCGLGHKKMKGQLTVE
jgi:cytochrome c oxidase subunit II